MNTKKLIWGGVVVIIIVLVVLALSGSSGRLVDGTLTVTVFTNDEGPTGTALASVPFLKSLERSVVSVSLDLNEDGIFSDDEVVISEIPVLPREDWNSGIYFTLPELPETLSDGQVQVGEEVFAVAVEVQEFSAGTLFDLGTVTNPEESMKGIGASVAYAQDGEVSITTEGVPDISQKPGECAPTSAANNLISLIDKNGTDDDKPGSPEELIDELKDTMGWTAENGVLPDDFVAGKNKWAEDNDLPITTEKVGDGNGVSTIDDIREGLENGAGVELRIKFGNAAGKAVGGHMVTVTGIHQAEGQTYLDINDPVTPDIGTETVEVSGNQITNYGPWEGITVLSWGFVETWDTTAVRVGDDESLVDPVIDEDNKNSVGLDVTPISFEVSFAHVKPGEYSEVYTVVLTTPGSDVEAAIDGPGVVGSKKQVVTADENGQAHFTWRINMFGYYSVKGISESVIFDGGVDVK